jgi:quercetin dioxygenase-like cupin family protein
LKITTREQARRGEPLGVEHFTGEAGAHALHRTEEPHPVSVAVVSFATGACNRWHRHTGGQVLHVIEGECLVQSRGEPVRHLRTGDSASAGPGEEHWHGATPDAPMSHVAVNIGDITWT